MKRHTNLVGTARYQMEVDGQLDEQWADWLEGMIVSSRKGRTVITSNLIDQSGLHGVLARIRDLGLPLLSLKRLGSETDNLHE